MDGSFVGNDPEPFFQQPLQQLDKGLAQGADGSADIHRLDGEQVHDADNAAAERAGVIFHHGGDLRIAPLKGFCHFFHGFRIAFRAI